MEAFLAVAGQWRTVVVAPGRIVWSGLDYGAARAGLELAGLTVAPPTWNEVRLIEAGAIEELNRGR